MKRTRCRCILLGGLILALIGAGAPAFAGTDSAQVPAGWKVWSCWYFAWVDYLNPNLYDRGEAMYRYDRIDPGANTQNWEYNNHGPNVPGVADWWGHCHAWSGASVWEAQPTTGRTVSGRLFRIRDRKGLMVESYYNDANGDKYELYVDNPTPGNFWRWLRKEIKGRNAMHGHAMGFVGELYYGSEIWNYPVYKYTVTYSSTYPYSGTIKIWAASDASPTYANKIGLFYQTFTYQFKGVKVSGGEPIDSGTWVGTGPYSRPDCIWRPYYPTQWTTYVDNPGLDEAHLGQILNE